MRKEESIKVLLIIILVLAVIGITGCQAEIPCSIEVTNPGHWESLDGNGTYVIVWDWIGPVDTEVSIRIIGYTQSEEEIGATLINPSVLATDESYIWGPNFGADIWARFQEDWPWWFKIQIESLDDPTNGFSEFFSVHWDIE